MSTTIIDTNISTPFEELDGSPQEGYTEDGTFEATRTLQCDWALRDQIIREILGDTLATDSDVVITRAHRYPGNLMATARTVGSIQGIGRIQSAAGDATVAAYEKARFQVKYSSKNNDQPPDAEEDPEVYSESVRANCEFMSVPNKRSIGLYKHGVAGAVKQNPTTTIIVPGAEWQITRKKMLKLPDGLWSLLGFINSDDIYSGWYGKLFEAGTLLWMPFELSREMLRSGKGLWSITVKMVYKPSGWNAFYFLDNAGAIDCDILWLNNETPYKPYTSTPFTDTLAQLRGS